MAEVKKKKKTRVSKKAEEAHRELWTELKERVNLNAVAKYNMKEAFPAGTAIEHPKFGIGIVKESTDGKIEVVFEKGIKDLVHQRN